MAGPNEAGGWVIDPKNPNRATYTDEDGVEYEAFKPRDDSVPFADSTAATPEQYKANADAAPNLFNESIQRQGGWGLSDETRRTLGADNSIVPEVLRPITDAPANVADLGFRGLQTMQAGTEAAALGVDKLLDSAGISDALSYDGNKFQPGHGLLALMEAFPAGGLEAGMMPHLKAPERKATLVDNPLEAERAAFASEEALMAEAKELFSNPQSTRADFTALAEKYGRGDDWRNLDDALQTRDNRTNFVSQIQNAEDANTKHVEYAIDNKNTADDLFRARTTNPDAPKTVDEGVAHVTDLTRDWNNPPRIEIADDFANLADEGLRDSLDPSAIGVTTPDGKVLINMKNVAAEAADRGVSQNDILSAVTYHEALGHYGLAQKFGDELDSILLNLYHNSKGRFKAQVDEWEARNPDAYADDINPLARSAEEVLAEMSEAGRIDPSLMDAFRGWMKETGRELGLNLKYSDNEIRTILGMSHNAVIAGTARDVAANGFRYARAYHGTGEAFNEYDNNRTGAFGFSEKGATYFDSDPANAATYADNSLPTSFGNTRDPKPYFDELIALESKYPDEASMPAEARKRSAELERLIDEATNGREPTPNIRPVDIDVPRDQLLVVDGKGGRVLKDVREAALRKARAEGKRGVLFENAIDTSVNKAGQKASDVYALFDPNADTKPGFGDVRYMRRSVGKGSEGSTPIGNTAKEARDAGEEYVGLGSVRSRENIGGILSENAPEFTKERWNDWIDEANGIRSAVKSAKSLKAGATPAEVLKARESIVKSANRIAQLSRKAADGLASERDMYMLQAEMARNADMQDALAGVRSNAARVVNSFKIGVETDEAFADAIKNMMRQTGNQIFTNPKNFQKLTQQIVNLSQNPAGVNQMIKASLKPKAEDYIFRIWYNMMLSSPATHTANILGTLGNFGADLLENTGAAVIGQRGRLSNADRVRGREIMYRVYGAVQALKQTKTWRETVKSFDTGQTGNTVTSKAGGAHVYSGTNKIAKGLSYGLEGPTRALAAEDEWWRNILSLSNIHGLAVRNAGNKGLKGKAFWNEVDNLITNPTPEMINATNDYTKVLQFLDKPSFIAKSFNNLTETTKNTNAAGRAGAVALKFVVPFVNTPDALIRTALRRTPVGAFERENIKGWKAGGAERDKVVARLTMGSLLSAWAASKAAEGSITGDGPADPRKRMEWEAAHQPNSIKVGDKWYSIAGLEPVSTNLTAVATMVERMKADGKDKPALDSVVKAVSGFGRVLIENSYTENLVNLLEAVSGGQGADASLAGFLGGIASNLTTPAVARKHNQMLDPAMRDTTGDGSIKDRIEGRVQSGWYNESEKLPQRYDIFGQPLSRDFAGPDIGSRVQVREESSDTTIKEMQRLIDTFPDKVVVGSPGKNVKVDGKERRLTAEEFQQYQHLSGYWITESVRQEMAGAEWSKLSDDEKVGVIKDIAKDMRKSAREVLFPEDEGTDD